MRINIKADRGDTIVEVLICILVISTILAGAFVTTNNSLQAVRMSQERAQAVKLAESQIERLRALGPSTYSASGSSFCIDNTGSHISAASNNACYFSQSGDVIAAGSLGALNGSTPNLFVNGANGPQYNTRLIVRNAGTYEISVRWVSVKGQVSNITMYYRMPV